MMVVAMTTIIKTSEPGCFVQKSGLTRPRYTIKSMIALLIIYNIYNNNRENLSYILKYHYFFIGQTMIFEGVLNNC